MDLDKLAEVVHDSSNKTIIFLLESDLTGFPTSQVSAPWMTMRTIQKEVWVMLNKDTDVNVIVKMLEGKAK